MKKTQLLLITCFLITAFAKAQTATKSELQKRESELKKEIAELTGKLGSYKSRTEISIREATIMQRKIEAREELVNNINKQVKSMDETIYQNERDIYRMNKEMSILKTQYAQNIVFAYKNRSSYQYLNFLFSATSFADALKRMTYLKSYQKLRETQVDNIVKTQNLVQHKMGSLNANKKEQVIILESQKGQLQELEQDKKEKDRVVNELKDNEKQISLQLRKKQKQRRAIQDAIGIVIKNEIAATERKTSIKKGAVKREKEKLAAGTSVKVHRETGTNQVRKPIKNSKPSHIYEPLVDGITVTDIPNKVYSPQELATASMEISRKFETKNLPWPVTTGVVSLNFGVGVIPETQIVYESNGIEISVPEGTAVKSVADGIVAATFDIGSGLIVVIRHGKYFTTYGGLASASVSKGQDVKAGTILGKSGTNDDNIGTLLFMVANDKGSFMDPKKWLNTSHH